VSVAPRGGIGFSWKRYYPAELCRHAAARYKASAEQFVRERARLPDAEQNGFDSYLSDHFQPCATRRHAPLRSPGSGNRERTKRVLSNFRRHAHLRYHPDRCASLRNTGSLNPGRVILGVGTGSISMKRPRIAWPTTKRFARLREAVKLIKLFGPTTA